jgi:MFS transporter, PCFT/HCP family, solute carrier family 46, member 3
MYIEPIVFLYNLAFMITSVVEQSFFLYQVCHNDFKLGRNICLEIERHPGIKDVIHADITNFQKYNVFVTEIITLFTPIILVFYFKFIDKKYFIILGLFGKLIYSSMIIINAYCEFSIVILLFTATLPCAFTGSDIIIISNSFAYLSERVPDCKKNSRLTFLNGLILSTMPIGTMIGKILFKHTEFFKNSYEKMFILNVSILLVSIILTLFLEKDWNCNRSEEEEIELSFTQLQHDIDRDIRYNMYRDKGTFKRILKIVLDYKVSLVIIISALHILQRSEKFYLYLFTQYKLSWSFEKFSNFKFIQTLLLMIVSIITALILNKVKINVLILMVFGAAGNILARVLYIIANNDILFYIGGCFTATGPLTSSSVKCYLSKIIHKKDLRKLFVITTATENIMTMAANFPYSILYINSNEMGKEWLFSITILSQSIILVLVCVINFL